MIATRRFSSLAAIRLGAPVIAINLVWAAVVYAVYAVGGFEWMRIPFLPLTTIGVAVSFYLGFKNNSAYDRFWEGRKIWGGIVNASRSWANAVLAYVRPGDDSSEAVALRRALIHRHLAWTNALRLQLRATSRFFDNPAARTKQRLEDHAQHMRNDWDQEIGPFLEEAEMSRISAKLNPATHLVVAQGQVLAAEHASGGLTEFRQVAMMGLLDELYTLQGKCERIKNTPLPRQYAEFGRLFVTVFVYLVPFGLLDVFDLHTEAVWPSPSELLFTVPYLASTSLIAWIFLWMERIGDASEDPFERSFNDVPMNALCRTIERDLRQLLGETELPDPEVPIDGTLY